MATRLKKRGIYCLDQFRVIDMGQVWAAPMLASILGDLGAEVIKVESRYRMDPLRLSPDNIIRDPEKDPWFMGANRNKLGVTLNLNRPKAIELLKALLRKSDVLIENYSPGTMTKLGIDYETIRKEVNSKIIYVSMPGMGSSGQLKDMPTYANTIHALSGLDSILGYPGGKVLGLQAGYADMMAGIHGAFAVIAALYFRERAGEGQHIELAQLETMISILGEAVMECTMNGRLLGQQGNIHPIMAPHNNYRCKEQDTWVSVAIKSEKEWKGFCKAMGYPAWTKDERFADRYKRQRNRNELDKLINEWTVNYSCYEVMGILQKVGVAAVPCLDAQGNFLDPHFQERQAFVSIDHPGGDTAWIPGLLWRMSDTPCEIRRPAPMIGNHNDHVFGGLLGLSEKEISQLMEEKVIW